MLLVPGRGARRDCGDGDAELRPHAAAMTRCALASTRGEDMRALPAEPPPSSDVAVVYRFRRYADPRPQFRGELALRVPWVSLCRNQGRRLHCPSPVRAAARNALNRRLKSPGPRRPSNSFLHRTLHSAADRVTLAIAAQFAASSLYASDRRKIGRRGGRRHDHRRHARRDRGDPQGRGRGARGELGRRPHFPGKYAARCLTSSWSSPKSRRTRAT